MHPLVASRQREPLCVVSGHIVFFFSIFYLYTEPVYFILLCNMSNKILSYHTMALACSGISMWDAKIFELQKSLKICISEQQNVLLH